MIKVTTEREVKPDKKSYPKLMFLKSEPGLVVLFSRENDGIVIRETRGSYPVGRHYTKWESEGAWEDFVGKITLENV